jgi:hypothetical protein
MAMTTEGFDSTGLVLAGEVETRVMREARTEEDYTNSWIAGAHAALTQVSMFAKGRIAAAGPYDDTRALVELEAWVADKIREVHSKPTDGTD